ncbi:MAG: AMIN domain-containing protein [Deltaproteobacteria bacterium]
MRSLARRYNCAFLAFLFLALTWIPATAATSGKITGVKLDASGQRLFISCKGKVGKPLAHVIGKPNRLVIDFAGTRMGRVPSKIKIGKGTIHELRVGTARNRTRVVVDFQNRAVPAFTIKPQKKRITVIFREPTRKHESKTTADRGPKGSRKTAEISPLSPSFVPATARPSGAAMKARARAAKNDRKSAKRANRSPSTSKASHPKGIKVAQHFDPKKRGITMPPRPRRSTTTSKAVARGLKTFPSTSLPRRGAGRRMVREVRPPVTPPTPDPRLLVQAVTELRFIQVGHNSRLIIRGGDHLDYRLNKVSPTKVRIDLINAEIPKAHQKPLRTDLFSTSVEMIVPGSQTIFVQLKDAVPYQVEKKKGLLMVDFPPPRFALTPDQRAILQARGGEAQGRKPYEDRREALVARRQAARIMREEEYRRKSEEIQKQISLLIKEQEDILKERKEVERKYRLTPDPEIFNKPVTMDFQGISLRNAFRLLAEQAGLNIIVGNEVKGSTTMRLFQVPLGQVIDHILKTHNLARDLVGNVMWIGGKKQIQASKNQRMKEYRRLLAQAQNRLKRNKKEIADLEKERERALRDLTKQQEAAEELPGEVPAVEEVGATETIEIDGEPVTLLLVKVKLNYAKVNDITPVLQCVFNHKCAGIPPSPGQVSRRVLAEAQRKLTAQGFQPGSPGARARLRTVQRDMDVNRRTRAAEMVAAETRLPTAAGALESGAVMDQRMMKILAHTVMWPNEKYNMLFIKDLPERIEEMKKLIYSLDVPTPQVLIESRLVQANRDWSRGLGILWGGAQNQSGLLAGPRQANWGIAGLQPGTTANSPTTNATGFNLVNGTSIPSLLAVTLPAAVTNGTIMGLGLQFGLIAGEYATDLDLRLQLGEVQGKTKVIAQPKVQVLDGEKATIKNGRQIAFLTVSADGTQTQLVDVDLLLEVEPTIYPDGRIEMDLKVTDNDVGDPVNGVASILTREATTIMIVKDGETAVIGGILRNTDSASRQGWPGLMNVPVLNFLFSNKTERKFIEELLVFVTPTIIKRPPPAS